MKNDFLILLKNRVRKNMSVKRTTRNLVKGRVFSYSWHLDTEVADETIIRMFGIDADGNNTCLIIKNFTPYAYLELPSMVEWDEHSASYVSRAIIKELGVHAPISTTFIRRHRLYGAHIDEKGEKKLFPYLHCSFSSIKARRILLSKTTRSIFVNGIGKINFRVHETDADPILQLVSNKKLPTAGWIEFMGRKPKEKLTLCDREYIVNWKNILPSKNIFGEVNPQILGFDIEVNSSNPSKMPSADKEKDEVFQISCILSRNGDKLNQYKNYLLTLGDPDQETTGNDVKILRYKTEEDLLVGFTEFIQTHNPNVLVGYNILGFDIPYMLERAKRGYCLPEFDQIGFVKDQHAREVEIKWDSSAYKNQHFKFLDGEGRLFVDLLPLVRRGFKFNNYKLKTVAAYFLKGITKEDLSPQGIFKCYRIGMSGDTEKAKKAMGIVGKYCVKDSILMNMLFEQLKVWVELTEMATVCNVPPFFLYTKGQQIKCFSQIYKKCTHEGIVVEKDGYVTKEGEGYVGAMVFPPLPGVYDRVVPFDFKSLYPSVIIAYNIDYSTMVSDEGISDSKCNVIEWEDHVGCVHDPKVIRKLELTTHINNENKKLTELRRYRDVVTELDIVYKAVKYEKQAIVDLMVEESNMIDSIFSMRPINNKKKQIIKREIEKRKELLKPYTRERSDIMKSKPKTIICEQRRYRFLKEPLGVLPSLLKNLLDARANTRKEIKSRKIEKNNEIDEKKSIYLNTLLDVLDKRQLAYKVSANSMYGLMGVKRGYLPFMPGAMCTTAMGRKNIQIVSETIPRDYGGKLVYGDTDSNYINFPHLETATAKEIWEYSEYVANEISKLFPDPIKLEFEDVIYWRFMILTKKRYMSLACSKDGKIKEGIKKKGVLLARRDNSGIVRDIYERLILDIFDKKYRDDILYSLIIEFRKMCSGYYNHDKFVITQAVGDTGGFFSYDNLQRLKRGGRINYSPGRKHVMIGDYKVAPLPEDEKQFEKKLILKKTNDITEYYLRCLPAQVQLAEKIKRRGQIFEPGTRLEYVTTTEGGRTGKKYEKIESYDFFKKHSNVLRIDYMWYLEKMIVPIDQVLNVVYDKPGEKFKRDFVSDFYKFCKIREKLLKELRETFQPEIIFE